MKGHETEEIHGWQKNGNIYFISIVYLFSGAQITLRCRIDGIICVIIHEYLMSNMYSITHACDHLNDAQGE